MPKTPPSPQQVASRARHASGRALGLATAILAGGLVVSPPEFREGVANVSANATRATLAITATVLPFAKINSNLAPSRIDIQSSHIEDGFIDINRAAIDVSYNTPKGFTLWVGFDPRSVRRVEMRIGGVSAVVTSPNTAVAVPLPQQLNRTLLVDYRLYLSPGVSAGVVDWPVSLGATASIE